MKKFVMMVSAFTVIVFALSAITAQADLMKSYESDSVGFSSENGSLSYLYGAATGVTQGTRSLGVGLPAGTWWSWIGTDWDAPDSSPPETILQLAQNHSILKADITLLPGSGQWSDYVDVTPVLYGGDIGWNQAPALPSLHAVPGTTTISWDYSAVPILNETQYMQVVWNVASPDAARAMYIDNVRFEGPAVPEPATIVLLAMGGLILLIRRRF